MRIAKDRALPLARFHEIKLLGRDGALHEVSELPPGHLGTVNGIQEPPARIFAFKIDQTAAPYLEAMTVAIPT